MPHLCYGNIPEIPPLATSVLGGHSQSTKGDEAMNALTVPQCAIPATLEEVVDRLIANPDLSETRRRDLRSAVVIYGKLKGEPLSAISLDLAAIRRTLDGIVPAQARVSRKRWANLRSDLAAALDASGLQPMLKTANVELDCAWATLLGSVHEHGVKYGLSRLARWATARQISAAAVDDAILERFFSELEATSLVRNLRGQRRSIAKFWNRLATRRLLPCRPSTNDHISGSSQQRAGDLR
jgi:hypothetical protein